MLFPLESLAEFALATLAFFTSVAIATILSQGFERVPVRASKTPRPGSTVQ